MAIRSRVCIVLCLVLVVVVGLAATQAEAARALAEYAAPPGGDYDDDVAGGGGGGGFGIRGRRPPGRWNVRSLQGGKREVPGGPDPQHHY
ncbi:hypothetical protein OsI_03778 [Oryza sativa Indica Group]|uniref:Uncharacterized protein n=1 Tax=Oryza sativa subsp. indica TaxID=39946 RepID=A2WV64_ORYSI|nr:hypothetical protein OsI_03778 [Oryza sativa Indica Group]